MLEKLLITASLAAILSVTPALAQDETQLPIIKKPGQSDQQGTEQGAGKTKSGTNQAQDNQSGVSEEQGSTEQQAQDNSGGDKIKKKKKLLQSEETGDQQQQTTDDQTGQLKKKKKNAQQSDEMTGDQQATGKKKKNAQQDQNSEEMKTGSTGKANTKITAEERTTIRKKIITHKVTRIDRDRLNFRISIGVAIPRTIHLYPLPSEVVVLMPWYRGYRYFILADGTIIIVEPHTYHIVYVLTA
jgi:hypothetical protein